MATLSKIGAVCACLFLSACIIKDPPKPAAQPECDCPAAVEPAPSESEGKPAVDPADPAPLSEEPAEL